MTEIKFDIHISIEEWEKLKKDENWRRTFENEHFEVWDTAYGASADSLDSENPVVHCSKYDSCD